MLTSKRTLAKFGRTLRMHGILYDVRFINASHRRGWRQSERDDLNLTSQLIYSDSYHKMVLTCIVYVG
jgi:hypothetical protein